MGGTKAGMTTWFEPSGEAIPCTIIAVEEGNIIIQMKTQEKDFYISLQIGYKSAKEKNISKSVLGHLRKVNVCALRHLAEFRIVGNVNLQQRQKSEILQLFQEGSMIDVTSKSIGKGF